MLERHQLLAELAAAVARLGADRDDFGATVKVDIGGRKGGGTRNRPIGVSNLEIFRAGIAVDRIEGQLARDRGCRHDLGNAVTIQIDNQGNIVRNAAVTGVGPLQLHADGAGRIVWRVVERAIAEEIEHALARPGAQHRRDRVAIRVGVISQHARCIRMQRIATLNRVRTIINRNRRPVFVDRDNERFRVAKTQWITGAHAHVMWPQMLAGRRPANGTAVRINAHARRMHRQEVTDWLIVRIGRVCGDGEDITRLGGLIGDSIKHRRRIAGHYGDRKRLGIALTLTVGRMHNDRIAAEVGRIWRPGNQTGTGIDLHARRRLVQ